MVRRKSITKKALGYICLFGVKKDRKDEILGIVEGKNKCYH